jgi:hypothetical protein
MAKTDAKVSLFYNSTYNAVEAETFVDETIKVTRGQGDEGAGPRPASVELTFNNQTDKYRPSNPTSPLYGLAGRNTPLRVQVGSSTRAVVEATEWSPDRTIDFRVSPPRGRATVDVAGYGLLGRINQWTDPVRSPFYTYNSTLTSSVGYWPFEDDRGSVSLFTPTAGAKSSTFLRGVTFDSQYSFGGSAPLADFANASSTTAGGFFVPGPAASTAGWQLSWAGRYGQLPGTGNLYEFMDWQTTDGTRYSLNFYNAGDLILLSSKGGVTVIGSGAGTFTGVTLGTDWNLWNHFVVTATQSGGTTTISIYWNTEGSPVFAGAYTASFSDNTSSLYSWGIGAGGALNDVTIGHVIGTSDATTDPFVYTPRLQAFTGYNGETAADRFARLMISKALSYTISGTAAQSWPMGPQPVDTFSNLLKEIAQTEDGLIFDSKSGISLTFRLRRNLYNQTPTLALSYPLDISSPFSEVLGDLGLHNRVTVSQRNGGTYESIKTTGQLSVQPPPAGVGEYRQTVDVNTYSETADLPLLSGYWLNRGTVAGSRFSAVTVELTKRPDLVTAASAVEAGDFITIDGYVEYQIRLMVIGIVETIAAMTRKIVYTCVPADLFITGVYDGTVRKYDLGTSTLNASYGSSVTTMVFKQTSALESWSTTGAYDLLVAGEQIGIPAGGMGAVTGSGPYTQTATGITRSKNGIVKAQASGAEVHTYDPARYGL